MSSSEGAAGVSRRRCIAWSVILGVAALGAAAWVLWEPGADLRDGRHDRGKNAIWMGHGWLGDDGWFERYNKTAQKEKFRSPQAIKAMAQRLREHRIADVFPHLCPTLMDGQVAAVDEAQVERFLDGFEGFRVMPWIGGAWDYQAKPDDPRWRQTFARSAADLLRRHPRFAGVHINIEPIPDQSEAFLKVLEALRAELPPGKVLSVSAHPPPLWVPLPKTDWSLEYYAKVAKHSDQIAVMAYNTGLRQQKAYQAQMKLWTWDILQAVPQTTDVLIGVPTYPDEGGYHLAEVENIPTALTGVHGALHADALPPHFQGVALYCAWEMDESHWQAFSRHYLKPNQQQEGP